MSEDTDQFEFIICGHGFGGRIKEQGKMSKGGMYFHPGFYNDIVPDGTGNRKQLNGIPSAVRRGIVVETQ
jgi:hypothetical protein